MPKFVKKPIIISAEQFFKDKLPWPMGVELLDFYTDGAYECGINTLEGYYTVTEGDWIITGVKGEIYPCKPDIFEMTYTLIDSTLPSVGY